MEAYPKKSHLKYLSKSLHVPHCNLVCIGVDHWPSSAVPRWWWMWTWGVRYPNVSRGIVVSVILMRPDNWKRGLHVAAWAFWACNRCKVSGSGFHYAGYHLHPRNTTRIHRSLGNKPMHLLLVTGSFRDFLGQNPRRKPVRNGPQSEMADKGVKVAVALI